MKLDNGIIQKSFSVSRWSSNPPDIIKWEVTTLLDMVLMIVLACRLLFSGQSTVDLTTSWKSYSISNTNVHQCVNINTNYIINSDIKTNTN